MTNESKAKPEEAEGEAPAAEETEQKAEATEATAKEEAPEPKADDDAVAEPASSADSDAEPAKEDPPADPPGEGEDSKSENALQMEALQAEVADLKDRLLRAAAEMENMRRRFEREMTDARQYSVTGFAREVLSIGDNLGRALSAVPEEARKESETMATLLEGVEMTERELLRVLDKHNVKRLEPHGEKFDPNFHQAMFEVEHDEAPHGTVVQVVQPGYSIGERVLRPAMVGVAKKKRPAPQPEPPKAEASEEKAESTETSSETASGS